MTFLATPNPGDPNWGPPLNASLNALQQRIDALSAKLPLATPGDAGKIISVSNTGAYQLATPSAASGASTFAYTATASPVPLASGDGLTLVGSAGAPVSTPTETEWDNSMGQGTTKPSPSLAAGVYLVTMSWTVAGVDVAGAYAYFSAVDAVAVPIPGNGLQINSPGTVQSVVVVADVPVRLGVVAGANNDDATRTFGMHLWATKIADFG